MQSWHTPVIVEIDQNTELEDDLRLAPGCVQCDVTVRLGAAASKSKQHERFIAWMPLRRITRAASAEHHIRILIENKGQTLHSPLAHPV
jgi:hypothetical protein